MKTASIATAVLMVAATSLTAVAYVGSGYTLFGTASYVSPGNASNRAVYLKSDTPSEFAGIDFGLPANLLIQDLDWLSTEYKFPAGVSCHGGAPRFQIQIDQYPGKNIFVYIGPPPNYTGCPSGVWTDTGDLLTDASLVDTSQLVGGSQNDTWGAAQARYAGAIVTDISLVTDNFNGSASVTVDNTKINDAIYTYEFTSANDCKRGGWKNFDSDPGPFRNQGQCVSHFNKNKPKF